MMDTNQILKEASRRIFEAVKDMAGTERLQEISEEVQEEIFLEISTLLQKTRF